MEKNDVCLSGAADGSDILFGKAAMDYGHDVCHISFKGHNRNKEATGQILEVDDWLLDAQDWKLKVVSRILKKSMPASTYTLNLLRRNVFQVCYSDAVYAISTIVDGIVQGGTGWAVHLYIYNNYKESLLEPLNCWVFDQNDRKWYQYGNGMWIEGNPPKPKGCYAGIGTRKINEYGKQAILDLYK